MIIFELTLNLDIMKLKIEYINEETNEKFVLKNRNDKVFYHDSKIHDPKEYEELSGKVIKLSKEKRLLVNHFYNLAGEL